MLPLEVIGVLGFVFIFFTIGALRAVLAKRAVRRKAKVQAKPLIADKAAGITK
jgi:hypothetical protein